MSRQVFFLPYHCDYTIMSLFLCLQSQTVRFKSNPAFGVLLSAQGLLLGFTIWLLFDISVEQRPQKWSRVLLSDQLYCCRPYGCP